MWAEIDQSGLRLHPHVRVTFGSALEALQSVACIVAADDQGSEPSANYLCWYSVPHQQGSHSTRGESTSAIEVVGKSLFQTMENHSQDRLQALGFVL